MKSTSFSEIERTAAMRATLTFVMMNVQPDPDDQITRIREPENTLPARLPV
jgi:hypothetical protein